MLHFRLEWAPEDRAHVPLISICECGWSSEIKGFHIGDARVKKLTPASKMCDQSGPII